MALAIPLRNTTQVVQRLLRTAVRSVYDAEVRRLTRAPDLEELRTFCLAAELGTLGRAATRLHVTQPAVSKRLRSLEELCGVRLLERTGRGVTLTAPGERLYAHARRILVELAALTTTLDELRGSTETLTLAISPTAADALLSAALVEVQRESNTPVEVIVANSGTVKRMVAAGQADVGVAAYTLDELGEGSEAVALFDDEVVVVAPLGHAWARAGHVSPKELVSTPIIRRDPGAQTRQVVDAALRAAGHPPPPAAVEVGTTDAAKLQAHAQGLPAVMSRLAVSARDRLEVVRVDGVEFHRRFCAVAAPGHPPAAVRLVEALRRVARP
jgi:DNA-binding transcriptional LysR family regulator